MTQVSSVANSSSPSKSSIWIRSSKYDLAFIMGGALLTLALVPLAGLSSTLLLAFFWTWIVVFEGSHFWATWSRSYLDPVFRKENSSFLSGSLVFFAFPLLAVLMSYGTGTTVPRDMYGFFIFTWSLYHNARQHFGFLSIYSQKAGLDLACKKRIRNVLYMVVGAAQFYFFFNTKLAGAFSNFPKPADWSTLQTLIFARLPMAVSALGFGLLAREYVSAKATVGRKSFVPYLYTAVCMVFYSTMFYVVSKMEPFYSNAANGAQGLMLIAVMNSLFHNIQYHAIVAHYGLKRYAEGSNSKPSLAATVNGKIFNYAALALLMGAVFGVIVYQGGDWPWFGQPYVARDFNAIAYVVFLGIIGHHFYLDQRIWRPSQQKDLKAYLGLAPQVIHASKSAGITRSPVFDEAPQPTLN